MAISRSLQRSRRRRRRIASTLRQRAFRFLTSCGEVWTLAASPRVLLMSCHMDSLEANKNVLTKGVKDNEDVFYNAAACEGATQ